VAREVRVVLTCDVDGAEGEEVGTVRFGFEGEDYEIELCRKHFDELASSIEPYRAKARRAQEGGGRRSRRASRPAAAEPRPRARAARQGQADVSAIRAWARANGYTVSDRGRVPRQVLEAYEAASASA
jgi:hypothetical protein